MTNWQERTQQYLDGSVEQRLEQVTMSCVQALMDDINHPLMEKGVQSLLTIDDMVPPLHTKPEVATQSFYGITKDMMATAMLSCSNRLGFSGKERTLLRNIKQILNTQVDAQDVCKTLHKSMPQLRIIAPTPNDLYALILDSVSRTGDEYLTNRPAPSPDLPSHGATR